METVFRSPFLPVDTERKTKAHGSLFSRWLNWQDWPAFHIHHHRLWYLERNKKAQLTQRLRATAPSFQDGRQQPFGFYRTTNSAIRSANPENPCLELNMEWIACTICVFHSNYASIYYRFRDIAAYWSKIATPLYLAPPLGVKPSDLDNDPW